MQQLFIFLIFLLGPTESITPFHDSISNANDELQDDTNPTPIVIDKVIRDASPCECLENGCSCSFKFLADNPNLNAGTVSLRYDADNGLFMSLRVGDAENHATVRDITSGVEFPPVCTRVPRVPVIKFCAVLYDVRLNQDFGLHTCISVESQAVTTTISAISFDCLNLSTNTINTMAPDQHRPSFVELHVGKSPKITFFNSVSVGMLPIGIPPLIEETASEPLKIAST